MKNKIITVKIALLIVFTTTGCKKMMQEITKNAIPAETVIPPSTSRPAPPSEEVGNGSGNLTINGDSLDFTSKKTIKVKAGNYKSITIINIFGSIEEPITITNNGQVNISESMQTDNLTNVIITGDGTSGISYGFSFEDIGYRAISLHGRINGITLKNMKFSNVNDYVISGDAGNNASFKYNGTSETRSENLKILNCFFDDAGTISFGGNLNKDNDEDSGFFKSVEIAGNTFQNTNAGSVASFSNVQDYDIHDNIVNNINQNNNNHNGVFFMQGNGKFYNNKLTNYQGNSIRMWLYSRGNSAVTVEIYNNICYNTRKYGAFELQMFDRNIFRGKSTYANAKVYNNTVGMMNKNKEWEGQILDLYNTGGTLEFYNNLGYNLVSSKKITNMINNMSDTKIIKEENNKYSPSQDDIISDADSFTSLFSGIGAWGF